MELALNALMGEAGNEKVAIRQDDRRRTSRQQRVCEEERTRHGVSEAGPNGPGGECYRVRRRVDRQDGAGRGERHGRPGRRGRREHRGLLDERPGGALGPWRGARADARSVDHPRPHRQHLAGRPVRAHPRAGPGTPGLRGLAGAPAHRSRRTGHDPLRGRLRRVPRHHGRPLHRIRARAFGCRQDRARRPFHPQSRSGAARL